MGESSAMDLYNVPRDVSFPGLGIGIIFGYFPCVWDCVCVEREVEYSC